MSAINNAIATPFSIWRTSTLNRRQSALDSGTVHEASQKIAFTSYRILRKACALPLLPTALLLPVRWYRAGIHTSRPPGSIQKIFSQLIKSLTHTSYTGRRWSPNINN